MGNNSLWGKISGFISSRKALAVWGVVALALIVAVGILVAISSSSKSGNNEVVSGNKEEVVAQAEESFVNEELAQAENNANESEEVSTDEADDTEEVLDYAAVFIVSINPKVKIYVDADGIVLKMEKMNADADVLLEDLEWANKKLEDCFNTLLVKAHEKGFLKENAKVSITVAEAKEDVNVSSMTQEMEKVIEETCKDIKIDIKLTLKMDDTEETMEKEIIGNTTDDALEDTILSENTEEQTTVEEKTEEVTKEDSKKEDSSDSNDRDDDNSGLTGNTPSNPPVVQDGYSLVWEDNFDAEELNRDDWNVELHEPGWVNSELQEYVDSEENIYLEDGKLVLKPVKTVNTDGTVSYTSGRVNTQNKNNFKYGKFEASVKVPVGEGYLPAFWLMAADENLYGQWPRCGEIDIMEVLGDDTDTVYGTIHYGHDNINGHKESQGTYTLSSGSFSEEFHTFTCEWEPGKITWYVDGIKYHEESEWYTAMSDGSGEVTYPAPFDQEFYIILNLAVGGNWPGDPTEDTDFENQAYEIDYVRVYQKYSYDENVSRPEKEEIVLREPDANGNYLINGDFEIAEDLSEEVDWQFKTAQNGIGNTTLVSEKDGVFAISGNSAIVETTNAGTVDYSIQLMQNDVPLKAGATYELSFDAYATAERTMRVNSKAPDRGWYAYLDKLITLTTEPKTYTYEFDMIHADDDNCTVEFNMGNFGSTETIVIDNVSLKIVNEDEDLRESILNPDKAVRADGNYIYNGEFKEGDGRLGYWDISSGADVSVTSLEDGRRLKVDVPDNASVTVSQKNVPVVAAEEYVLSLDAEVPSTGNISVNFDGADYTIAAGTNGYWEKVFTASNGTNRRDITFTFSGKGTYYLDNVRIDEQALIKNGSFNAGFSGYSPYEYSTDLAIHNVDSITYDNAAAFDINSTGDAAWKIQLKQNGVDLEKDQWYKLLLDAKSTINRKLMFAIQRDGSIDDDWTPYSGEEIVDLTSEWQTFELSFQMTSATDLNSVLSISMGAVGGTVIDEKHSVYIDNIILEKIEAPVIEEVPVGENMLSNTSFESGELAPWELSTYDSGKATSKVENNSVIVTVTNVGTTDGMVALKYNNLTLEPGSSYNLTFKAMSTEGRVIKPCFMDPTNGYKWYGGEEVTLDKNVVKDVDITVTVEDSLPLSHNVMLQVGMGLLGENTPLSDITLTDFKLVKLSGDVTDTPETPSVPEIPIGTELLEHGDFTLDDTYGGDAVWALWPGYTCGGAGAEANINVTNGNAEFVISNLGSEAWNIQLEYKNLLTLEKGCSYVLKYDIKSTEAREIKAQLANETDKIYVVNQEPLEKDALKTVKYGFTFEADTNDSMKLSFQLGKMDDSTPLSTITIDNISIVKVEKLEDVIPDEGEDTPGQGTDIPSSPELSENNMFERGGFSAEDTAYVDGGTNIWDFWPAYAADGSASLSADTAYGDGCVTVSIANEGTVNYGIQLKYNPKLTMEKGATYTLTFDVISSVTRGIVSQFQDSAYTTVGWKMSDLYAGETKQISYTFVYDKETSSDYNFCINMGKMDGAEAIGAHTISFDNFNLIKVSDASAQTQTPLTLRRTETDTLVEEETEEESVEESTTETESTEETTVEETTTETSSSVETTTEEEVEE